MEITQLGRYLVVKVLGRGAMGVVYLARDPVIGRELALKTLTIPPDSEDADEFHQRFLREAQAAGRLNHPGIVTVHDAGVDEATGLSFMAMEYIEGRSLKDLQRAGHAFPFSEVARIGAALAGALDYAHSKGVVHRDIKPANIIFTPQGLVKITDFGVARLEASNLTATGQFIGTPNYMSPEQVTGAAIDGRSDLFSLGVVLFELLTGTRPFLGGSLTEVTYKIVHEAPPIPSQLRAGLPPAFNPIVLKLLEKSAEKRYARGADVARALDALRRVLSGASSEATQQPPAAREPAAQAVAATQTHGTPATQTKATELEAPRPAPLPQAAAPAPQEAAGRGEPAETPARVGPAAPVGVWHLPIAERWVAAILAVALLPPAVLSAVLYSRIDRGPWPSAPPSEPGRRHRVAALQRQAEAAVAAGNPQEALRLLEQVWPEAPYSPGARAVRRQADELLGVQQVATSRLAQAATLLQEGKELLSRNRPREAQSRFEEALELTPDDGAARQFLDLARERQRLPQRSAPASLPAPSAVAPTPAPAAADARLELYFNSPLPAGSVELLLDGQPLKVLPFSFYSKGFLGLKKKGTGKVEDGFVVAAGDHTLLARLTGEDGKLLGEQSLPARFQGGSRVVLKIEMDNETAIPRFALAYPRSR